MGGNWRGERILNLVTSVVALLSSLVTIISFISGSENLKNLPDPIEATVAAYRHYVQPLFVSIGNIVFGWVGLFYTQNHNRIVDLIWTVIGIVIGGFILERYVLRKR